MKTLTNEQRKSIAVDYYTSISNNKVLNARMSPKYKGFVSLRVYNPTFKEEGNITIGIRPEFDELLLMSEIGIHGTSQISKFNKQHLQLWKQITKNQEMVVNQEKGS